MAIKTPIVQKVTQIVDPIILEEGLELVDVEYFKAGKNWLLRLYIDKPGGVLLEDCQNISRQLSDLIDINEIITVPFTLEVSSPGLDRPLKKEEDFRRFIGKKARVQTFSPIDGQKKFVGVISDVSNSVLKLQIDDASKEISLDKISKARLEIEF
ncbi:MAG: ribosome maturation factor RimP [Nitrospinae bacterium CG11_big_fil_rev_8_21_14_0_20_45_15]|nr:MAG: ribosome maturation factor RimP [Nitrospinae bacterium CG11_big_fil_rev_8_21_14_0_20_45_15]